MGGSTREADLPTVPNAMRLLSQLACNCHGIYDTTVEGGAGIKLGARPWHRTITVLLCAQSGSQRLADCLRS